MEVRFTDDHGTGPFPDGRAAGGGQHRLRLSDRGEQSRVEPVDRVKDLLSRSGSSIGAPVIHLAAAT